MDPAASDLPNIVTPTLLVIIKILGVTGAISFASVELGGEFFTALNTGLNFAMLIWVSRTSRKSDRIETNVKRVREVAEQLDTSIPGGHRHYDTEPLTDG